MDLGLPSLPAMPGPEYRGPTPWSNWVIRPRLIAGAYPAGQDDGETDRILTTLLELGVTTFVCLQAEFSLHTSENLWRTGQGLRPYIKDAQRLIIQARTTHSQRILQEKLDFLHLPILDGNVTTDTAMSRLVDDCCLRLLRGERLYVHCWGGHGRTGTVIATMLGRLYHLPVATALRYTQAFHDTRRYPQGVRSPQTPVQIAQVRRLLPDPPSCRGVKYLPNPLPSIAAPSIPAGQPHGDRQGSAGGASPIAASAALPVPGSNSMEPRPRADRRDSHPLSPTAASKAAQPLPALRDMASPGALKQPNRAMASSLQDCLRQHLR
ncbi:hypothetical protein ACKKBG_A11270 [Auxenochlorella protothecoides x Auxenochlorella symbiontica]